jgi:hypothetical protein
MLAVEQSTSSKELNCTVWLVFLTVLHLFGFAMRIPMRFEIIAVVVIVWVQHKGATKILCSIIVVIPLRSAHEVGAIINATLYKAADMALLAT